MLGAGARGIMIGTGKLSLEASTLEASTVDFVHSQRIEVDAV
jgi:hypothetical protein